MFGGNIAINEINLQYNILYRQWETKLLSTTPTNQISQITKKFENYSKSR